MICANIILVCLSSWGPLPFVPSLQIMGAPLQQHFTISSLLWPSRAMSSPSRVWTYDDFDDFNPWNGPPKPRWPLKTRRNLQNPGGLSKKLDPQPLQPGELPCPRVVVPWGHSLQTGWPFVSWKKQNPAVLDEQKKMDTPLKFNIAPEKMVVGRLLSYWEGNFSGAMLNFRGISTLNFCWTNSLALLESSKPCDSETSLYM